MERLQRTSADEVSRASASTEGLSEEDEQRLRRRTRHFSHQTRTKIRQAFSWFLFGLACVGITIALSGFLWLLWDWVQTFRSDAAKLGAFLSTVVSYVLVVLATLFVQGVLKSRDED